MIKLLVLDKDGTLVRPKSGNTFVQHPEDQELIEGVSEAITRYVADGWQVAIASNQGGCEVRWCHPSEVPIGSYCLVDDKNVKCEHLQDTGEYILLNGEYKLPKTVFAKYQYKTIDMAIAEMRYAMKLTGISDSYFCPDMKGANCLWVNKYRHVDIVSTFKKYEELSGSYRKPDGGMLRLAQWRMQSGYDCRLQIELKLMIGDRSEDLGSAQAAGFDFVWAEDWRNNELDKVLPYRSEEWIALNS